MLQGQPVKMGTICVICVKELCASFPGALCEPQYMYIADRAQN